MSNNNREVEQAISALTVEVMKISNLEGEERATLCLTIENAISRLAAAILSQVKNEPEFCPTGAVSAEV